MAFRRKARIRKVAVVVRPDAPEVTAAARRVAAWLAKRGIQVLAHADWAGARSEYEQVERTEMMRRADLIVVLGGDGSLLGMARLSSGRSAPVVGLHHGDFGFLTEGQGEKVTKTLEKILAGRFTIEHRSMLAVAVKRGRKVVAQAQALNDAVIARGTLSRMITIEATIDAEYLATYLGDGLVVASPTGSTAYSLSAGGPVVEPTLSAMILTPISPHTLSSRPLVLSDRSRVSVRVGGGEDVMLSIDGQESVELMVGDTVEVTKSKNRAAIVKVSTEGFFGILRRKLSWGARGEGRASLSSRPRV